MAETSRQPQSSMETFQQALQVAEARMVSEALAELLEKAHQVVHLIRLEEEETTLSEQDARMVELLHDAMVAMPERISGIASESARLGAEALATKAVVDDAPYPGQYL